MSNRVENMGTEALIREMMNLNPNTALKLSSSTRSALYVIGDPKRLVCPKGYHYSEKYGITNKGKDNVESYESVSVVHAH